MTLCPYDFGLWSVDLPSNVIIRMLRDAYMQRTGGVISIPPARSYNAGRARLVDGGLCTRRRLFVFT